MNEIINCSQMDGMNGTGLYYMSSMLLLSLVLIITNSYI